jgi:hypothetical protein
VWTTLGKAAEIKDGPTGSLSSAASLSPVAIDESEDAPPQTDGDVPWHVRNFGEKAPRFRPGMGRPIAGVVVLAAIGCMMATATRFADATGIDFTTRSAAMLQAATEPTEAAPPIRSQRTVLRESEQTSVRDVERFAMQEIRFLREVDLARRMRGDDKPRAGRQTSRAPATSSVPVRPSFIRSGSEPSPRITNPFDPLNGIL